MPYIDQEEKRYLLGIHRATVVDRNDNPDISEVPHRGRIQVSIPYLDENGGDKHPIWCDYCGPSHQFFSVPAVGTLVYVMFNGGNPEQPAWIGAINTTNATKDPPTRNRRDDPDVSGYESLNGGVKGHVWEFNDIAGERRILIEDINNNYMEWDTELNDLNVYFANNENREIGNDRFTDIGNDDQLDIVNDNRITIGNDQTQDIGNNQTETIGNNQTETIGNNQTLDVGFDQTETIGNTRTQTITLDDILTVLGMKTQDITGTWDDTITGAYSRVGQSTGDWDFQGSIGIKTAADLALEATGTWAADITGETTFTFSDKWTAEVSDDIDFTTDKTFKGTATQNIEMEATLEAFMKNTIFECTMSLATMTIGALGARILITPASVSIVVGGTSQTWTAGGSVFVGSTYVLSGVDHIPHMHPVFLEFTPTGPPF